MLNKLESFKEKKKNSKKRIKPKLYNKLVYQTSEKI